MTITHALLPIAAALAVARRPIPWALVLTAAVAAAAPDLDVLPKHFLHLPPFSTYGHRGASHSLFVAIAAGLLASAFHKRLGVQSLTAGVVVGAAMASHGLLDMLTDQGLPVAYLWPVNSARFFADWRPLHATSVHLTHLISESLARFGTELWRLVIPMFALALSVRAIRVRLGRRPGSSMASQ